MQATTDYTTHIVETSGPIARITLNRPGARDAFDEVVIAELTRAFQQAGALPAVRAFLEKRKTAWLGA
jgi:methylglutaconyl-CoA hydratase